MNPYELAEASLKLLIKILDEGEFLTPEMANVIGLRNTFIERHGRNITYLAGDMLFLYSAGRHISANPLIRVMLENMFCVGAAVAQDTFAIEKMIGEFEHAKARLEKIVPTDDNSQEGITNFDRESKRLKDIFGSVITNQRWRRVNDIAVKARLERQYLKDYFLLSDHAHGAIAGLMKQELQIGIGQSLSSAITAILITAVNLTKVFFLKDENESCAAANDLMRVLLEMIHQGEFVALDKQQ